MKQIIKNRSGSLMMQVIVSIFILSLGLVGSLALIVAAIESNRINQNRMIAINLAQEGLEMVRNMRDTNWLTYSSNLRECWNFWDDTDENGILDGSDAACVPTSGQNQHPWGQSTEAGETPRHYLIDFDESSFRWILVSENRFDDIAVFSDGYRLYKTQIDGSDFYTHKNSPGNTETVFSRQISIYYIDDPLFDDTAEPIAGGHFPAGQPSMDNRLLIISRVYWTLKGKAREVELSTIMTDYLDRHEWTS